MSSDESTLSQLLHEHEIKANKLSTLLCILSAVVIIIVDIFEHYLTSDLGYDPNPQFSMAIALALNIITAIIAALFQWDKKWIKYLLISTSLASVVVVGAFSYLDLHVMFVYPVLLACIYFKKRITIIFSIITVVFVPITYIIYDIWYYFTHVEILLGLNMINVDTILQGELTLFLVIAMCIFITNRGITMIHTQANLTQDKETIEHEIGIAAAIQSGMVPHTFPDREEFSVGAFMGAAKEVGGDFYDFFMPDEKHAAIIVADVSGKGLPASLFMVNARSVISSYLKMGLSSDKIFEKANKELCGSNSQKLFVTAWLGILDMETGTLHYVNAGHNPPAVLRDGEEFTLLKSKPGFVLGRKRLVKYIERTAQLPVGSRLFIYTDGVTEAMDTEHHLFGEEKLLSVLNAGKTLGTANLLSSVEESVREFAGDAPQSDDITMVLFDYHKAFVPHADDSITVAATSDGYSVLAPYLEKRLIGCNPKELQNIMTAVSEIFANISMYAYRDADTPGDVTVKISIFQRRAKITFIDSGRYFNPLDKERPDLEGNIKNHIKGGLGIFMVQKMMDDVRYRYENRQNILTIEKDF